jgi:hypothetical protein
VSPDRRQKDANWQVAEQDGRVESWEAAQVAVLMDIRDELKRLNSLLHCGNFIAIPSKLERIARNTVKPRKRKKP